jgi:hypothetical protein
MKPILCKAGQQLRLQVDDSYPDRLRASDGWVADARHVKAGTSDHIPDPNSGYVRALDLSRNLCPSGEPDLMPYLADQIRDFAKRDKSKRIAYIIFDKKIASARSLWRFRPYRGSNPHIKHMHVSFTKKGDTDGSFFNIPMIGGSV